MAQTGDALIDIELPGTGSDGGSSLSTSPEVEVQDTDAIVVGLSETEAEATKRASRVLATPAVRYLENSSLLFWRHDKSPKEKSPELKNRAYSGPDSLLQAKGTENIAPKNVFRLS